MSENTETKRETEAGTFPYDFNEILKKLKNDGENSHGIKGLSGLNDNNDLFKRMLTESVSPSPGPAKFAQSFLVLLYLTILQDQTAHIGSSLASFAGEVKKQAIDASKQTNRMICLTGVSALATVVLAAGTFVLAWFTYQLACYNKVLAEEAHYNMSLDQEKKQIAAHSDEMEWSFRSKWNGESDKWNESMNCCKLSLAC